MKLYGAKYPGCADSEEAKPKTIADIGCGIGGSARYLARKYQAKVSAITLSPVQVKRAVDITAKQGLSDLVINTLFYFVS